MKTLEIRTSLVFNFDFANNTILSCFFFFRFIIYLHFLIPVVIAKSLIRTTELIILTGKQIYAANAKIETQPLITEDRISKCSI